MNEGTDGTSTHAFSEETGAGYRSAGAALFQVGAILAGRYEVRGVLGVGGSAVVYRCRDQELRREVALKLLPWASDNHLIRLRREVALGSGWEHPNLLRLYDIGSHEGMPFCTMPVAEGGTLAQRLRERGRLFFGEALPLIEQLLEGLTYLHGKGFVHRDIKPSNIFFDADGALRVGDFGIVLDPSATRHTLQGEAPGTPRYMAPEYLTGEAARPASDLWSAGVSIREMLGCEDSGEMPEKIPRWFLRWLSGLLQAKPSQRFQSAGAALAALRKHRAPPHVLRWRAVVLAVTLLGLGAAAGLWKFWPALRPEAALARFEGNQVLGISSGGSEIWGIPFSAPVTEVLDFDTRKGATSRFLVLYGGFEEVGQKYHGLPSYAVLSASGAVPARGSFLRDFNPFGKEFREDQYHTKLLAIEDLDQDGHPEALVNCQHIMYPSLVYAISSRDGRCVGAFANSGHLYALKIARADVTNRWGRLIFCLGINNRMGRQVVAFSVAELRLFKISPDISGGNIIDSYRPMGRAVQAQGWSCSVEDNNLFQVQRENNPFRLDLWGILDSDPWFGDAKKSNQASIRLSDFYRLVSQSKDRMAKGEIAPALAGYREADGLALDRNLLLYSQLDSARTLQGIGRPDLALTRLPADPENCPAPGRTWIQLGSLLCLDGRYAKARDCYLRAKRHSELNNLDTIPGFVTASLLDGAAPGEIYQGIREAYPDYLAHSVTKAWMIQAGLLRGEAEQTLAKIGTISYEALGLQMTAPPTHFPQRFEIWSAVAELAAGRTPVSLPDRAAVEAEGDPELLREYGLILAYRELKEGEPGALGRLGESFRALREAARSDPEALVPCAIAAYTCGFTAMEGGQVQEGKEALREGLRIYPKGPLAARARKLVKSKD